MLVYKKYDQAALDRQYNNRLQVPEYAVHLDRWEMMSRQTEKEYFSHKDIGYGKLSRERLDIYPSSKPGSKTLVFIHGGYWQKLDKSSFHFVAGAFHDYNITTVLITYPLAPAVEMDQIVASCRLAMKWIYANISKYNGDPAELYLAGHSAGGHLVSMLLTPPVGPLLPDNWVKGACALSGLYNLTPIRLSDINEVLKLDELAVSRNSPVQLLPVVKCPLLLAVGGDESQEFRSQSQELYESWKEKVPVESTLLSGINHYTIVEEIPDKQSFLHRAMLALMNVPD
jgi:arylformamidase